MQDTKRCPKRGSGNMLPIRYGYPSPELVEESYAGRVVLGGCILFPDSPDHRCGSCGHEWRGPGP
jgi:hypothetical protein